MKKISFTFICLKVWIGIASPTRGNAGSTTFSNIIEQVLSLNGWQKVRKKCFFNEVLKNIIRLKNTYLRDVDYDEKGRGKIACAWESRLAVFLQACPQKSILAGCIMVFKISRQHLSLTKWMTITEKPFFSREKS